MGKARLATAAVAIAPSLIVQLTLLELTTGPDVWGCAEGMPTEMVFGSVQVPFSRTASLLGQLAPKKGQ
jgi:hypothetical protein